MSTRKVTVMECDNPDCGSPLQVVDKYEPVLGYHFNGGVQHHGGGGGPIPKFFACQEDCIIPAMNHVLAVLDGRV